MGDNRSCLVFSFNLWLDGFEILHALNVTQSRNEQVRYVSWKTCVFLLVLVVIVAVRHFGSTQIPPADHVVPRTLHAWFIFFQKNSPIFKPSWQSIYNLKTIELLLHYLITRKLWTSNNYFNQYFLQLTLEIFFIIWKGDLRYWRAIFDIFFLFFHFNEYICTLQTISKWLRSLTLDYAGSDDE